MAGTGIDGSGTTVTVAGFTGKIISVDGPSAELATIDSTTMASTVAMDFIPAALYDPGSVDLTVEYLGEDPVPGTTVVTVTIAWAGSTTTVFSGWISSFSPNAPLGDRMTASISIKATGVFT